MALSPRSEAFSCGEADEQSIAVALTKMYLVDKAEKRLMVLIRPEQGVQNFDASSFVLTNGVACDCKAKVCKFSKYDNKVDAGYTQALSGKRDLATYTAANCELGCDPGWALPIIWRIFPRSTDARHGRCARPIPPAARCRPQPIHGKKIGRAHV